MMADRLKHVGVFKQIIRVFVYLNVPFLFYCLVKVRVHQHKCMTKKRTFSDMLPLMHTLEWYCR